MLAGGLWLAVVEVVFSSPDAKGILASWQLRQRLMGCRES